MIPDDLLQMLTAAVDGELTPAEGERVRQALAESAEARELHARLQADSRKLRNLSVATPPADLRDRVMARLPFASPTPVPVTLIRPAPIVTPPSRRAGRSRPWLALAVAASLLLSVSVSSFLFFVRQDGPAHARPANTTAQTGRKPPRASSAEPSWADILPRENAPLPSVPPAVEPPATAVAVAPASLPPAGADRSDDLPPPRPVEPRDVLGFRVLPPIPPLDLVQVRLPFLAAIAELDRADVRQKLADELGRDPAFRIDLFVTDLSRGIEVFQAAARDRGVTVAVDATAQDRIKRKLGTAYLVYTESLSPAELRDLLFGLPAADAKGPQRVLETLHVTPAQPADHKELKDVFGVDPGPWKHPGHPHTSPGVHESKPLSAGTADQVAKTLTSPPGKPPEKPALLMTLSPAPARAHAPTSKELRQFFEHRGERKPSAVPVVLVIRQVSGG